MLEDAFTHLEGQVEPVEFGVALLQVIDHAQRLQVVFKAAEIAHAFVERILPGMAERRVTEIVRQRDGFHQILMQIERTRDTATDLRHFEAVREPGAEQIALMIDEDLGLVFKAAKSAGMDDAITVALEFVATGWRRLGIAPSLAALGTGGVWRELRHFPKPVFAVAQLRRNRS